MPTKLALSVMGPSHGEGPLPRVQQCREPPDRQFKDRQGLGFRELKAVEEFQESRRGPIFRALSGRPKWGFKAATYLVIRYSGLGFRVLSSCKNTILVAEFIGPPKCTLLVL